MVSTHRMVISLDGHKKPNKNTKPITHQKNLIMTEKSHQTNLNCDSVSQQIQVEKQAFKCIINLNTTVCGNKSKHRKTCSKKHRPKYSDGHTKQREYKNKEKKSYMREEQGIKLVPRKKEEYSWKWLPKNNEKHKSEYPVSNPIIKEKIAPSCFRKACWDRHECIKEKYRRYKVQTQIFSREEWKRQKTSKDEAKHEHRSRKHHHHRKRKQFSREIKHTESRILLSPISSSPLEDNADNLTYEDISNTSLEIHVEKPSPPPAYKCYHKPRKHYHGRQHKRNEMQESKLDTLIRRAKERERKLVEKSRGNPVQWFTSTPVRNEYSSADIAMSCSDMDISFSSRSTFVLGQKAYSPSSPIEDLKTPTEDLKNPTENLKNGIEDLDNPQEVIQSIKTERVVSRGYSPSSPTMNYTSVPPGTVCKLLNIKNEPTMDIEAYSPTSTPKINYPGNKVKKEIVFKSEPLFSCATSPIYFANENDERGLEFCKIESVKSEFIDNYLD